jgi:hypothetical protein
LILRDAPDLGVPLLDTTKIHVERAFELVINLRAAKGLGLVIPQSLLARADHIIEKRACPRCRREPELQLPAVGTSHRSAPPLTLALDGQAIDGLLASVILWV